MIQKIAADNWGLRVILLQIGAIARTMFESAHGRKWGVNMPADKSSYYGFLDRVALSGYTMAVALAIDGYFTPVDLDRVASFSVA